MVPGYCRFTIGFLSLDNCSGLSFSQARTFKSTVAAKADCFTGRIDLADTQKQIHCRNTIPITNNLL
ncbi:hypothetical protein AGR1C_pAt40309 [Agrobacterium fabacearum TT111]|nr:hypothetical protein AGR1C_pAt40309 [Agrobacterium fabacearum TT111]